MPLDFSSRVSQAATHSSMYLGILQTITCWQPVRLLLMSPKVDCLHIYPLPQATTLSTRVLHMFPRVLTRWEHATVLVVSLDTCIYNWQQWVTVTQLSHGDIIHMPCIHHNHHVDTANRVTPVTSDLWHVTPASAVTCDQWCCDTCDMWCMWSCDSSHHVQWTVNSDMWVVTLMISHLICSHCIWSAVTVSDLQILVSDLQILVSGYGIWVTADTGICRYWYLDICRYWYLGICGYW
jgi:hypothetical protein